MGYGFLASHESCRHRTRDWTYPHPARGWCLRQSSDQVIEYFTHLFCGWNPQYGPGAHANESLGPLNRKLGAMAGALALPCFVRLYRHLLGWISVSLTYWQRIYDGEHFTACFA